MNIAMKRIYIKPETERFVCDLMSMVAASPNPSTQWNDNTGGSGDHQIGPGNPNPDEDAKANSIWDDWSVQNSQDADDVWE